MFQVVNKTGAVMSEHTKRVDAEAQVERFEANGYSDMEIKEVPDPEEEVN